MHAIPPASNQNPLKMYLVYLYFFRHTYYTAFRSKNEMEKLAIVIKNVILILVRHIRCDKYHTIDTKNSLFYKHKGRIL